MNGNVPVTVEGSFGQYPYARLVIGGQGYYGPSNAQANSYWFAVVDLSSLDVVVNEVSADGDQIPQNILPYDGNPKYLLILSTLALRTDNVPQGPLYDFLRKAGAGPMLSRAEQINEQLGTGSIGNMSYILAATLNSADDKGFEEFSFTDLTIMTFTLMPVSVGGQTVYTPIQTGT